MKIKPVFVACFLLITCALSQNVGPSRVPQNAGADAAALEPTPFTKLAEPHYQAEFPPLVADGQHDVSWDRGFLIGFGAGGAQEPVSIYDKTGKWLYEDWLAFENPFKVFKQNATATSSGAAVVAASFLSKDGAVADTIVKVTRQGIQSVIRTNPLYPLKVCAMDDGTVWAYGLEMRAEDRMPDPRPHYPMLREYSFEKGELRTALDRATFRTARGTPVDGKQGEFQMKCVKGKVILVSGVTNEIIEYDLASSTLSRWPMTPLPGRFYINGAAVTDSGEIYVSVFKPGQGALIGILHLRFNSSGSVDWTPLTVRPSRGSLYLLLGNDGDSLVYAMGRSSTTLYWSHTDQAAETR